MRLKLGQPMDTLQRHVRTLIVDDSADVRLSIRFLLQMLPNIKVVGMAGDGFEAIAWAAVLQPDLVLLDVQLPSMSGIETASQLRRSLPRTQVVIVTVYDTPGVRRECREAGARGFITKERLDSELPPLLLRMFSN